MISIDRLVFRSSISIDWILRVLFISKDKRYCFPWRVGELIFFEALIGGAFDRLSWQHSGDFDQTFSQKSNAPGYAREGGGGRGRGFGIDWYTTEDSRIC